MELQSFLSTQMRKSIKSALPGINTEALSAWKQCVQSFTLDMGKKRQIKKILTLRHLCFQTYWKLLSNDLEFCKQHSKPGIVDSFKTPDMAYWYLSSGESEDSDTESQRDFNANDSDSDSDDTDYEAEFLRWKAREAKGILPRQR